MSDNVHSGVVRTWEHTDLVGAFWAIRQPLSSLTAGAYAAPDLFLYPSFSLVQARSASAWVSCFSSANVLLSESFGAGGKGAVSRGGGGAVSGSG